MYKRNFIYTWKDLKESPLLFLPDILGLMMNLTLFFLFLKFSGILSVILNPEILSKKLVDAAPAIELFFKQNMLKVIFSLAIFVLTSFVIGSGFMAMKLGIMKTIIKRKKVTLKTMIQNGKHVGPVISMKMLLFVIGVITSLFFIGSGVILSFYIHKGYVTLIMLFLFPMVIILLQLMTFFRYQIMVLEKKHSFIALRDSFYYFLRNKKYVFLTWLIALLVSLITAPLSAFLGFSKFQTAIISFSVVIGYIIRQIMIIILDGVWVEMFKFRSYNPKLLKP